MMERDFNLIDEPWILVKDAGCHVKEISMQEALLNAHQYRGLAGETKTQDFAVFRMLLAVIYTVFSRYDPDGNEMDPDADLVDQWEEIWAAGKLPESPINRYLEEWHDRFWLFDEQYPFYQTNAVKEKSKPLSTSKMDGSLFQSANKARLFMDRSPENRALTFPEAARWLLHLICFDDIAAKNPTPKKTWCGKLSLVALVGTNLFETLMLNYRADYDPTDSTEKPTWEADYSHPEYNREIQIPDNQAALLTLRSRHVFLVRDGHYVRQYYLGGGDWFEADDVAAEQMTLWSGKQDKKDTAPIFYPKRYDRAKHIWREFSSICVLAKSEKDSVNLFRPAGVISWQSFLIKKNILDKNHHIRICTASVIYDFSQATSLPVKDSVSDTLSFHAKLLDEVGVDWRRRITEEIGKCDKAAYHIYDLYRKLQFASGRRDKDNKEAHSGELDAKQEFYARIDRAVRLWLDALDTDSDMGEYCKELESTLYHIAMGYAKELAGQVGADAIFGRIRENKPISAADALNEFQGKIRALFAAEKNEGEKIEQS